VTFIVFEGIDGSGKTTQIQKISRHLQEKGWRTFQTAEPSTGPYGRLLRDREARLPPQEELDLYLKDRRWHLENEVQPALQRREIVLQDRYYYSTIAYQGASQGNPQELRRQNLAFCFPPDLAFYLDISPELALARISQHRQKKSPYEKQAYLEKVRTLYLQEKDLIVIDASAPLESVTQELLQRILPLLPPQNEPSLP
jgi:dTMP kinase